MLSQNSVVVPTGKAKNLSRQAPGDAAYLDVAEPGFFHLFSEVLGVFQCGDGALRLRQVRHGGAQCAEHGLYGGRLIHRRPTGDGNAAAQVDRAGVVTERRLFAGCVRQIFPFNSNAGRPPCGCLSCASLASGDSAVSLAPYVRCDVRGADSPARGTPVGARRLRPPPLRSASGADSI